VVNSFIFMDIPRIVIAGVKSKIGKTMVSIGLMRALKNRGYIVQPYKVGPDFIDPSFHLFATGRHSRNLDDFMLTKADLIETFERNFKGADIAIVEGKTGLYDSHDGLHELGSTAHVAKILKAPVILIADVERMNRSIAAVLMGYKMFDPDVDIRGVILNRIGNPRHERKVKMAVEMLAKLEVLGAIPRLNDVNMPYRHLGLIPAYERDEIDALFDQLAEIVERYVNVDRLIDIAHSAPELEAVYEHPIFSKDRENVTVGVIRDKAFSFYYQDNVDALSAKAKVIVIDSLKDKRLPNVDALYIGGGFPEVFAEELERNVSLRRDIYEFCDSGKPVYAECGGLMFLGESIITKDGEYEMVGFLPFKTRMHRRFQALGYCVYRTIRSNVVSVKGDTLKGHEFHYSEVIPTGKLEFAFRVLRGKGIDGEYDGVIKKNTLANYIHLHVLTHPGMVYRLIRMARKAVQR